MESAWTQLIDNFHVLRPWWLMALIPAVLLFLGLKFRHAGQSAWARAIDPGLLQYLLDSKPNRRQLMPLYGLLAAWTIAALALAGPTWRQIPMPVQQSENALIIVLDLSLSMYANDLSPDRVTRAQRKITDILNDRDEGLTALVVYAGDAHTVVPLTDDVGTIHNLVPALDPDVMPVLGSDPAAGVQQALSLLDNAGIEQAQVLLMTDGILPGDIPAIERAFAERAHTLSILGIGTREGAPIPTPEGGFLRDSQNAIVIPKLERELLETLSSRTRGRYADIALTNEDFNYLLDESIFAQKSNLVESGLDFDTWQEAGPWLVLLILPLAALAFRRGWLLCLPLALVFLPAGPAQALEWESLWLTRDQQANRAFNNEEFDRAAGTFKDSHWRATAHYRNGDYERALEALSGLEGTQAHYNRGNTLAHLNRFEEAIEAYETVLGQAPDHDDARHNKEVLEELLAQQQEQPQTGGKQQDQQEEQQQQEGSEQEQQQAQNQENQEQDASEQQQEQQSQSDQQQTAQEQQQQEGEQQDQAENESEQQEGEQPIPELAENQESEADLEEQQSLEQWLRRIPDDPGELLRNKFRYQSMQRLRQRLNDPSLADQPQQERIW